MGATVTLDEIVVSLQERGFLSTEQVTDQLSVIQTQLNAVIEEAGEVSRHLRRYVQRGDDLDLDKLGQETADIIIAATCLLMCVSNTTEKANQTILKKLSADNQRGWLHSGLSRVAYEIQHRTTRS